MRLAAAIYRSLSCLTISRVIGIVALLVRRKIKMLIMKALEVKLNLFDDTT